MAWAKSNRFPKQPLRDRYAFVVDGDDEKWYLQRLSKHETKIKVHIKPELNSNRTIEEQLALVCELADSYTKVFWVIDLDVVIKQDREWRHQSKKVKPSVALNNALKKIEDQEATNIFVIINTPGLEFWFLLHFESTSRYYNTCDDVIDRLKRIHGSPLADYQKSEAYYKKRDKDIYLRLKPYLNTARANAANLRKFDIENMQRGVSQMNIIFDELGI